MTPLRKDSLDAFWGETPPRYFSNPPRARCTLAWRDRNGMIWTRLLTEEEDSPLTLRETAAVLGVDPATVHRLVSAGRLAAKKRDGVLIVRFREVVREARERGIDLHSPTGTYITG